MNALGFAAGAATRLRAEHPIEPAKLRVLELFCGLGGAAVALGDRAEVAAAVDIHQGALAVYRHNFPHPTLARTLETLSAAELAAFAANLWWLSPPCQPFTVRGQRRDDLDPRSRALLALVPRIAEVKPPLLALENVPGFAGSRTHARLLAGLTQAGYTVAETELCPSELGWPNRRRRFYLVASQVGLLEPCLPAEPPPSLADCLLWGPDEPFPGELVVSPELVSNYHHALDVVDAVDPAAVTACFTSAYGRSPVRSGSYLRTTTGLRRFAPAEILRLLGFPAAYRLPPTLPTSLGWRLAGNSLSVPAVRWVLSRLPGLQLGDRSTIG